MLPVINLADKFSRFADHWSPKIVADLNDSHVKLVKVQGEFVWHSHAEEDELFLVLDGELEMELRDGTVRVRPGEFLVVPHGVEHRPVARAEVKLMLIEPAKIKHTGDVIDPRTLTELERI
jgi:mannose-6-phosphate isomerase-like protein (cupin superfamily)